MFSTFKGTPIAFLAMLAFGPTPLAHAEPRWIKAKYGSFEAISDEGRKPATQALSQFEQFSYALGSVLGAPEGAGHGNADLKLDPPLRIIVFRNEQELAAQCGGLVNPPADSKTGGLRAGRDRLMACTTAERQLPQDLLRALTRTLLESNLAAMPGNIEKGIETFFSTLKSTGIRVTWGAPPAPDDRTRDWALLHMIVTQPEYAGKARIYLRDLAGGMDKTSASRNAFGEEGAKFDADVDKYYAAGVFSSAAAPNRGLNPDRDFTSTALTSDEGELMRADLLTPGSEAAYKSLLKAGKHMAEANEGLALLAMARDDENSARSYMAAARKEGTKNFVALTSYAELEKDPAEAIDILKEALTIDPKYARAHWIFGDKLTDPSRRMAEWKQAVALAPRNGEWWSRYAQLSLDRKQYAEAGRAWVAAAQAAPDTATREHYLSLRSQIETQRLDAEEAERRKDALEKAQEIDRLKAEARKELAGLEARANARPLSADPPRPTVDWYDTDAEAKLTGTLIRVNCANKQFRLEVKDDEGKTQTLLVADPSQLVVQGGTGTLSCGAQKQRRVAVAYRKLKDAKAGVAGEATGIEFNP